MQLFVLQNLASQQTTRSAAPIAVTRPAFKDKAEFRKWCADPATQHVFYSAVEGLIPSLRVSEANPAKLLHGLVADYDAAITDQMIADLATNAPIPPTWTTRTFSGGARLLWEFSEPILCDNKQLAERFMKMAAKELKLKALLPGLDDASFELKQMWEAGTDWRSLGAVLQGDLVGLWVLNSACAKSVKFEGTLIPIEEVAAEVAKQFPGKWPGKFEVGARGPLFWVDDGITRIGCQVGDLGMICYSSRAEAGFLPWGDILGKGFVQKWEAAQIGAFAETLWYDGKVYWWNVDGDWVPRSKDDSIMHLKVLGVSNKATTKATASQAEMVLCAVQASRTVGMAAPLLFEDRELVEINGERTLNIGRKEAMAEADVVDPDRFPWLQNFLANVFDDSPLNGFHQLDYFLAWFKRLWESARAKQLAQGQMLAIAGEPGQGKTFMSTWVIGAALGGSVDASRLLQGKTDFNKQAAENAIWRIDDGTSTATVAEWRRFGETLKQHVANPSVGYHPKFRDSIELPWKGRIVLTCNTDPDSMSLLPSLDNAMSDKIMMLKFGHWYPEFLPSHEQEAMVAAELPFFLAWLKQWTPPQEVMGGARYGVVAYKHPEMAWAARESGGSSTFKEILELWREGERAVAGEERVVKLSATALMSAIRSTVMSADTLLKGYSPTSFGRELRKLVRQGAYSPLTHVSLIRGVSVYHFDLDAEPD